MRCSASASQGVDLSRHDLSETEARLVAAVASGSSFAPRGFATPEICIEPSERTWGADRTVRGEVVRDLIEGDLRNLGLGRKTVAPRVITIVATRITGSLQLHSIARAVDLRLFGCWLDLEQDLDLQSASLASIHLYGCWSDRGVKARRLQLEHDFSLARSTFRSEVALQSARIGGQFNAAGAVFRPTPGDPAIQADGLRADGGVYLDRTTCLGEVRFLRAEIGSELSLSSASLSNPGADALSADGAEVKGGIYANTGLSVQGAVRLHGAHIDGQVSLTGAHLANPGGDCLLGQRMVVAGDVFLDQISTTGLLDFTASRIAGDMTLSGAHLNGGTDGALQATSTRIEGDLQLDQGFTARGEVRISDCDLDGSLHLNDALFTNGSGPTLTAINSRIRGDIRATSGLLVRGEMILQAAAIGGNIVLSGATLQNPGATALHADRLKVGGGIYAGPGFSAEGSVRLLGAAIEGQLILTGARLSNAGGMSVQMDGAHLNSDLAAAAGTESFGEFRLAGTRVNGQVILSGATLQNEGGSALTLDGADVSENVYINNGFIAHGMTRAIGATIGGQLHLSRAMLNNPRRCAFTADGATIGAGLIASDGLHVRGEMRLIEAEIEGQAIFSGATIVNPEGATLIGDGLKVHGNLVLSKGFTSRGTVRLLGATVSAQCQMQGARFLAHPTRTALLAEHLRVIGSLFWRPSEVIGAASFAYGHIGIWVDDQSAALVPCSLIGLTYDQLSTGSDVVSVDERLAWIGRDPFGYSPGVYKHLADTLRRVGDDSGSKRVQIASERMRRRRPRANRMSRVAAATISGAMRWTVGYGYRPWLAIAWLVALIGAASTVLWKLPGRPADYFVKTSGAPEPFNPLLYAVDTVLPFIDFGYARWVPTGNAQVIAVSLVALGWVLATAVVAALAGLLRRGD